MSENNSFLEMFKDNLCQYASGYNFSEVEQLRISRRQVLMSEVWGKQRDLIFNLPRVSASLIDYSNPAVKIIVDQIADEVYLPVIESLIPWRKGPFMFNSEFIDSEWLSNLKWDRVVNSIHSLENKFVLDIGCNNGYYMFRMLEQNPKFVLGIEPSERCWLQFHLFQHFIKSPALQFELLGVEHVHLFPNFFHTVFCMGIIYHQRSPIDMLRNIYSCMRKGSEIIVETMAIPGEGPYALCVPDRYAKMHNVFFIPTASCLESWMLKAKFSKVELISEEKTTTSEQRRTKYAPYESLEEFLDPNDPNKTTEGFPAPLRIIIKARKI
jgi:tRNA (mo5U34)-methyltransferase